MPVSPFHGVSPMNQPVLAAQLYTVRQSTQTAADLAVTFKKVRTIGYRAVQVSGIGPISDEQVAHLAQEAGLTICITHTPFQMLWEDIDAVIARHKLWHCRHVALSWMPNEYHGSEEGFLRFAKEANQVGRQLFEAGLTFSYHNHSFEFCRFGRRNGLELLFEETDPRYLRATIDTYWIQHGGANPVDWILKVKDRMPVVHLKDMLIRDDKQEMAEIGQGNMNWKAILAACVDAGVEWYAVEQDICRGDPFDSLKISYDYLRSLGLI
jgi:sugar phosphate isomerase/epimerase